MEVVIIFLLENGWLPARLEEYMWNDLKSLGATKIVGVDNNNLQSILEQYSSYKKIYVEGRQCKQRSILYDYKHPQQDAVYIFGNSKAHNLSLVAENDDVLYVPIDYENILPWAISIAGIVLYDRRYKLWQLQ